MTTIIPGLSRRDGTDSATGAALDVAPQPEVRRASVQPTVAGDEDILGFVPRVARLEARMVDDAVETVLKEYRIPESTAHVLMHNMSKDVTGTVANAYYNSKAAARAATVGVERHNLTIKYALTDDDVKALIQYAPEFRLNFAAQENHDHPMAAASRLIDHRLILSRVPYGVPTTDVGGNPLVHIKLRHGHVHVCGPTLDVKDPMRHRLRAMEARRLMRGTDSDVVRDMAERYLNSDDSFVCGKMAHECTHPASVLTSVHVYDIDIDTWPDIMNAKGATVVEGCLLFSDEFFQVTEGVLPVSKARYRIDSENDRFEMGFQGSPSWEYSHAWSKYSLYGCDQTLCAGGATYSYKVVERRGDTLFFRILKLEGEAASRPAFTSRRSPGFPLVEVHGFELDTEVSFGATRLRHKTYRFPRRLWNDMVAQAAEDYERGVLDFTNMYNHYRTISAKQTINAVLVMGGEQVSREELVPLVTHSCLAAVSQSLLGQRTTRGITDALRRDRLRNLESTLSKVSRVFRDAVRSGLDRLRTLLTTSVSSAAMSELETWVLSWEPVVEEVSVPINMLQGVMHQPVRHKRRATSLMREAVAKTAPFDHFAAVLSDPDLKKILAQADTPAFIPDEPVVDMVQVGDVDSRSDAPSYVSAIDMASESAIRKAAIQEHITEIKMNNRAVEDECRRAYASLTVRGKPNESALKKKAELYRNPDMWFIRNGTIVESISGMSVSDFHYSALFTLLPDPDTRSSLRSVSKSVWEGEKDGVKHKHVNFVIAEVNFTGWALATDDLVVHNGPEILASMDAALSLPHDYSIVVHRAPPGSGKTYTIVHSVKSDGTDVIMCPVRESIADTRAQVVELHTAFPRPRLRIRTVDSYLTNHVMDSDTGQLQAQRLLGDECFMTHAGKWYAAAALLGVSEIHAYGDFKQIPHIPRVRAPKLYVQIRPQRDTNVWTTRRCPPSAVAAWGSVYDWKVRSLSVQTTASMDAVRDVGGLDIPDGCVMMCMYQADKAILRKKYATHLNRVKILTAHESEGKTYKHVWLHRFDMRKRIDNLSLFDQQPHVLVAMSRHTHGFKYVRPMDLSDLVDQWIKRSKDPRRLAAAADIATAGTQVEFL